MTPRVETETRNAAGRFVLAANPRKLAVIRALTWAIVFAVIGGVASNITAALWYPARTAASADDPDLGYQLLHGIGEAFTPATLGFMALALAWLMVAVGTRRLQGLDG